jgi:hypothetical protein
MRRILRFLCVASLAVFLSAASESPAPSLDASRDKENQAAVQPNAPAIAK